MRREEQVNKKKRKGAGKVAGEKKRGGKAENDADTKKIARLV
jgi:hypothetical protein